VVRRARAARARRRLRVLVLCHETLVPPRGARGYSRRAPPEWRTELDVLRALRALGHEAHAVGAAHDVEPVLRACRELAPEVVFNLLVEFHADPTYDQHVASLLELLRLRYTGCNPRGLTLARDKALSKQILAAHGVDVPRFQVFARDARVRREPGLAFPLIVKSRSEEASLGLARASLVRDERALARRVALVHERLGTDAIAEEYLDGRELYSAVLGGTRPVVLPTWELVFTRLPRGHPPIATRAVKFSPATQRRLGVRSRAARLPAKLEGRVARTARATWRALGLSGYARIDLRLAADGRLSVLEANPNPELARGEDFADAAREAGLGYPELICTLLRLALR
jgi:D-alanine-D-alanine ligase